MRHPPFGRLSTLQPHLQPQAKSLQPTTHIKNHRETILLYRALLRQSTYLPDPAARKYIWSHITSRFHAYHRTNLAPDGRLTHLHRSKPPLAALKDARKSLKYLQRANDGHVQHLHTILSMTYGRVGKRKRQLISTLQAPNPLTDDASVALLSQQITAQKLGRSGSTKEPQLTDQTLAVLKSQIQQGSSRFQRAVLKCSKPQVPELNAWGRRFPERRRANVVKKWYATTLERLMPPLGAEEWERLRGLATGETKWGGVVPQRPLGTTTKQASSSSTRSEFAAAAPSIHHLAAGVPKLPHRLTSSTSRIVPKAFHKDTRTNPHILTPRFMRGMWGRVFQKCPRLDWDGERGKWMVRWGDLGKKEAELVFHPHRRVAVEMFEGVDDFGKVIRLAGLA
ncbi:MAG: hypothetical protein Q9194_005971 [Teloschistes cf. exilis]